MSLDADHVARTLESYEPEGEAAEFVVLADHFLEHERRDLAASALDRAYGLDPHDPNIARQRAGLLDELSMIEHGIRFRYVPAGTFLMGSTTGESDERPVHPVRLGAYWLSEVPITWATFCDLMGWQPPPGGMPPDEQPESENDTFNRPLFYLYEENKIRLQYCETQTQSAHDWHAHAGGLEELFAPVPREDPNRPFEYNVKPMVSVSWMEAEEMCTRISSEQVIFRLPTEAQWEKGARGGRIQNRFPWGDDPPTIDTCDFDHFGRFYIRPPQTLPPNGYGLHGMAGGVWEWTADFYDSLAYAPDSPLAPENGPVLRTIRGGSWSDCAEAVTVSYRMSLGAGSWRSGVWGDHYNPNVGFRICRMAVPV